MILRVVYAQVIHIFLEAVNKEFKTCSYLSLDVDSS